MNRSNPGASRGASLSVAALLLLSCVCGWAQQEATAPPDMERLRKLVEVAESSVYYIHQENGSDDGDGSRERPWKTEAAAKRIMKPFDSLVYGASWHVDAAKGNDSNPGTRDAPWKTLSHAVKTIKGGDEILVNPGIYIEPGPFLTLGPAGPDEKRRTTIRLNGANRFLNRAVITGAGGIFPFKQPVYTAPNTRIKGLWFGSKRDRNPAANIAFGAENVDIVECVFFNIYQLLAGSTANKVLLKDNLLVHMGGAFHFHPIYFSGGPNALGSPGNSRDMWVVGNVFINGEGWAIHAWHRPANMTVVGNFATGHVASMVLEGGGHIAHHNFFWKEMGVLGWMAIHRVGSDPLVEIAEPRYRANTWLANVDEFYENILGAEYPCMYPELTDGRATHIKDKLKVNYILPRSRVKEGDWCNGQLRLKSVALPHAWYQFSEEDVEEAVHFIDRYFDWAEPCPPAGMDQSLSGIMETGQGTWRKLAASWNTLHITILPKPEEMRPRPLPTGPAVSDAEDKIKH